MDEPADVNVIRARRRLVGTAIALGVLVVVGIIAIAASGGSDAPSSSTIASAGTSAGTSAITQPPQSGATTVDASAPPIDTAVGVVVTVAGTVKTVLPSGDFVVDDGRTNYTVVMSAGATITDVDGATAAADLIQLGGSVQVTGTLTGTNIIAQTVIVPVRPVPPPTDS
jgi:hypothetical protein